MCFGVKFKWHKFCKLASTCFFAPKHLQIWRKKVEYNTKSTYEKKAAAKFFKNTMLFL